VHIWSLSLTLSLTHTHTQTQAAGRQALKDPWLIWPINCHCQGRDGKNERERERERETKSKSTKNVYPQCSFKKKEGQRYSLMCSSHPPHHLPVVLWASHWLTYPLLPFIFSSLFCSSLLLRWDNSSSAMKPVWQLLPFWSHSTFSNFHLSLKPQLFDTSLTENLSTTEIRGGVWSWLDGILND